MPCYNPLQAYFVYSPEGKRSIEFSNYAAKLFHEGLEVPEEYFGLPCCKCVGCRLERSRQWAMRCMHEASLYDDNCFITLTYDDNHLPEGGTLVKKHFQDFLKRLRRKYVPSVPKGFTDDESKAWMLEHAIRYYYCGEYGERLGRPHYHACLFNFDFPYFRSIKGEEQRDKEFWKMSNGEALYTSKSLSELWPYGFSSIGSLTFDSAAYVARYCMKKINGPLAEAHYQGKFPEYGDMSRRPGIARGWYEKFKKDAYPSDYLVMNGAKMKPPRYYDNRFEIDDPEGFLMIKESRLKKAFDKSDDNSYRRLKDREYCKEVQTNRLFRPLEVA